jgi:hypothetical protein
MLKGRGGSWVVDSAAVARLKGGSGGGELVAKAINHV